MKRNIAISILLLACGWIISGCAAVVLGVSAAAGIGAANVAGRDTRLYDAEYQQTVRACRETLNTLMITAYETESDESVTTIRARHADQTPVKMEVARAGPGQTEVGVRTGVVGIMGLEASNEIHVTLKRHLGRKDMELAGEEAPAKLASAPEQSPAPSAEQGRSPDAPAPIPVRRKMPPELTIYFERDSNELLPAETAKLERLAETMIRQPQMHLKLNGYTDAVGSADYNRMVAASRASSVKAYLIAKGVDPLRMTVVGKGARDFAASNDSEAGRSLNRRVEIDAGGKK
jgi:outer membrane protein OmpA-like peptidoglycan-associated protein